MRQQTHPNSASGSETGIAHSLGDGGGEEQAILEF
jgi:hypothetical protein